MTEIKDIKEKIEIEEVKNDGEEFQFGTLKNLVGIDDKYNEMLYMEDGELVYVEEKVSKQQAEWLEEMDIHAKQNIIPIYTGEQFKKIGTGEEIIIEEAGGEKYKFNMDSHYVLQNDIDLNCSEENQWEPIGTYSSHFGGILDGKNNKIEGIYINGGDNKAIFYSNSGTIQNIILNGYIQGRNYIAGMASINNENGKIYNCKNQIEILTANYGGAFVGRNFGLIENCENNVYLDLMAFGGGICGQNMSSGIIKKCINTHELMLRDYTIGGIVGSNSGIVEESYNIGNILAPTSYVRYAKGGIVGSNSGTIKNCYNIGEVDAYYTNWNIGGIAGSNETNGSIEFSYNVGNIQGKTSRGGIIGNNKGNIKYCYTINTNEMSGGNTGIMENCMKLTESQMQNKSNINLENGETTTFIELLNKENNAFSLDNKNINKGYPILK